jgi:hypothetical protein
VPLGLTLIEAQKYARRAEQLAVLKTFAEGELLRRLPFRNLVGGSLSFPAETKLPRVGFRAVNGFLTDVNPWAFFQPGCSGPLLRPS